MTQSPVTLPAIALEAGTEMFVSFWFVDEGDEVLEGDRLVEIIAGPVTFDVPAPTTGRLVEIRAIEDERVQSGDLLAIMDTLEEKRASGT
jgi:pyruvate/2-oxoglutarate dehydrogenase complex dihydrolipoamide acyltransferase (E2) component